MSMFSFASASLPLSSVISDGINGVKKNSGTTRIAITFPSKKLLGGV